MPTTNQTSRLDGSFTPTTKFPPNKVLITNANGYAYPSDVDASQLENINANTPPTSSADGFTI